MPIKLNGSTSGYTQIQAAAVATNNTLTLPTTGTNLLSDTFTGNIAITGNETVSGNMTVGGDLVPSSSFLRNRIINGAMVIDQRNSGASGTANNVYTVDRFVYASTAASKGTWQQNAGSVTPPIGFSNYLGFTSSSSYAVTASDYFMFYQVIEGYNVADFAWGTANAKTVTLSFQVYSSLTGTFGGAVTNASGARAYPFSYTVSSANTWTSVTVTIPGDTTGTWPTTNAGSVVVRFGLGSGSNYTGTAGAWAAANTVQPTGTVSIVGTNAATFYFTGVQLEVGSNATPFERRLFGTELSLCQRYYYNTGPTALSYGIYTASPGAGTNAIYPPIANPVTMRAVPSVVTTKTAGGTPDCTLTVYALPGYIRFVSSASGLSTDYVWTASAEL